VALPHFRPRAQFTMSAVAPDPDMPNHFTLLSKWLICLRQPYSTLIPMPSTCSRNRRDRMTAWERGRREQRTEDFPVRPALG
jgi:hypothetical protein